ncbi:MAG: YbaB/EbfC family nucleoid-associated protein [Candidatus Sericytochromatia bacterium]|nr:YbaB/EbfC family nucleoid-associated protein [Candidatus Sericytochromatia bacterium]
MRGPGGFGGMDMGKLMKQAQKMQEAMQKMQEDLSSQELEGSAGGGAVTITMTGSMEVTGVRIKPEAVDPEDVETLEDLVLAALKDAKSKVDSLAQSQMGSVTGGMNLPGLKF